MSTLQNAISWLQRPTEKRVIAHASSLAFDSTEEDDVRPRFRTGGFNNAVAVEMLSRKFSIGAGVYGLGGLRMLLHGWFAEDTVYHSLRGTG